MIVNKIYNGIYEIENFITDEENEQILTIVQSLNEKEWFVDKEDYTTPEFWFGKSMFFSEPAPLLIQEINERIQSLFMFYYGMSNITCLNRYAKSESMGRHRDNHTKDGDTHSAYGVVLYYNDNYIGGEIEYPELDIKIKPKARSLIVHSGDILHGTCPVIDDNTRYFSTAFVKEKIGIPVKLNPQIFGESE
jgi:hypothetical protein